MKSISIIRTQIFCQITSVLKPRGMKTTRTNTTGIISAVLITLLVIVSCNVIGEIGNGNVVKEERKVSSFNAIEVSGAFDVELVQGTAIAVTVEADDNLMDLIRTEVRGNTLVIENKKPIAHSKSLKVYITFTELKSIDVSGAVKIESVGKFNLTDLSISGSGASDGILDMDVQKLKIDCSGGGKLKLSGSAKDVEVDASGAVDLYAFDFPAENYKLDISGAGKAEINVSKELNVEISGAASVHYKGNPVKNVQDISGAGSVKKVD
jgi:Putative auto-transporter adhesin, head GIN domain